MLASKPVGRNASTKKYDILTALASFALSHDKGTQRLVLRLMVLITARYNWGRNELSMGRREIARIWAVDERTVKREMGKLRNLGWMRVKVPAARGRVAVYSINFDVILSATEGDWASVGPDFVERMGLTFPQGEVNVVKVDFGGAKPEATAPLEAGEWGRVQTHLRDADPDVFRNWYGNLTLKTCDDGDLVLRAPNNFIASYIETHLDKPLLAAAREVYGKIGAVRIEVDG